MSVGHGGAYKAEIELLAACIRVFGSDKQPGVDPYVFSASVSFVNDGGLAILKGVTSDGNVPFIGMRQAVVNAFGNHDVHKIVFERREEDGSVRQCWVKR